MSHFKVNISSENHAKHLTNRIKTAIQFDTKAVFNDRGPLGSWG